MALPQDKPLPPVSLHVLRVQGRQEPVVNLSEYKGKVLLLSFWATWCPSCREEMPSLIALWNKYHDQGFEILAINVDNNPARALNAFETEVKYQIPFPQFQDPNNELSSLVGVYALPTNILVARDFKPVFVTNGEDWESPAMTSRLEARLKTAAP